MNVHLDPSYLKCNKINNWHVFISSTMPLVCRLGRSIFTVVIITLAPTAVHFQKPCPPQRRHLLLCSVK